jgi:competence protein ComEA
LDFPWSIDEIMPAMAPTFLARTVSLVSPGTHLSLVLRYFARRIRRWIRIAVFAVAAATGAWAQLPEGPGREETEKLCTQCHDLAKSLSIRQDRNGWGTTLNKMVAFGMKGADEELLAVRDYLAKNFPAEELPPVQVNKARAIQLESRLSLKRSEAAAIIRYREEHGEFKSIEDLKKVEGVDFAKIEAKKDQLVF